MEIIKYSRLTVVRPQISRFRSPKQIIVGGERSKKQKKKRWNLAGIGGTIRFFRQGRGKNCDKREEERDWDVFDPLNV